ncbi:DUF-domain-containing protein [Pyrenophora seminiperda CCB06]|uniref:DUF-domain-containing protein n=1 Tax=Pyrenophora seminiperda CCB06 TaxID=1302712 RepID=A0A3M7MCL2_9PLEO|nr:DUF-domain-containing protein [Pyrenophora seminiperda CCB06]
MSEDQGPTRLETELELLNAMYPNQTQYDPKSRELKFSGDGASLLLRLPDTYPESGLADIISATDAARNDVRVQSRDAVRELGLTEGEEALDAIIATFQQLIESAPAQLDQQTEKSDSTVDAQHVSNVSKTIIVWLHHLLNTNKRKLALSPPSSTPPVSGLTKPGYPGILIYSGPSSAVMEHVNILKMQNWQAFQVRFEEEELWQFAHGTGVKEMESMSEIVQGVTVDGEVGVNQKKEFLEAIGIK